MTFVGSLVGACRTDAEVLEGEHLDYHHSSSLDPCAGTADFMDGFPPFLVGLLDAELPARSGVEYRWLDEGSFERESSRDDVEGIARRRVARARTPILVHELVHTVMYSLGAISGNAFFDEGVAYAYTPLGSGGLRLVAGDDAELESLDLMSEILNPDAEYFIAGSFVGFLVYVHGPIKLLVFLKSLGPLGGRFRVERAFLGVYGVTLEHEVDRYMATTIDTICEEGHFSVQPYECAQELVGSIRDEPWEFTWNAECSDARTNGGIGGPLTSQLTTALTINVEVAGSYTLELLSEEHDSQYQGPNRRVSAIVGSCGPCPFVYDAGLREDVPSRTIELSAGRYFVRLSAPPDYPAEVGLRIY